MRIQQHLVVTRHSLPDVEYEQFLVRPALGEKVTAALLMRSCYGINLHQGVDLLLERLAARYRPQDGFGVPILGLDPGAGYRTVLIFQPPVRVGNLHSVKDINHAIPCCRGWSWDSG